MVRMGRNILNLHQLTSIPTCDTVKENGNYIVSKWYKPIENNCKIMSKVVVIWIYAHV